jgi:integrase
MVDMLDKLTRNGPFVFTIDGERPISGMSDLKARLDDTSKVKDWRFHDLRRTLRSGLAELGISYEVAERVIGHAMPTLERTYNVHSYRAEKARALQAWTDHVVAITTGLPSNVTELRARA